MSQLSFLFYLLYKEGMSEFKDYLANSSPISRLHQSNKVTMTDLHNSVHLKIGVLKQQPKNYDNSSNERTRNTTKRTAFHKMEPTTIQQYSQMRASSIIYRIPEMTPPEINFDISDQLRHKITEIKDDIVTKFPAIKSSNYNSTKIESFLSRRTVLKDLQSWLQEKLRSPPLTLEDSVEYKNMIMGVGMKEVIRLIGTRCAEEASFVNQIWELTWSICREIILYLSSRAHKCEKILQEEIDFFRKQCDNKIKKSVLEVRQIKDDNVELKLRCDKLSADMSKLKKKNKQLKLTKLNLEANYGDLKDEFERVFKENMAFHLKMAPNGEARRRWVRHKYLMLANSKSKNDAIFKGFIDSFLKQNHMHFEEEELSEVDLFVDLNRFKEDERLKYEQIEKELQEKFKQVENEVQTDSIEVKERATVTNEIEQVTVAVGQEQLIHDYYQLSSLIETGTNTELIQDETSMPTKQKKIQKQNKVSKLFKNEPIGIKKRRNLKDSKQQSQNNSDVSIEQLNRSQIKKSVDQSINNIAEVSKEHLESAKNINLLTDVQQQNQQNIKQQKTNNFAFRENEKNSLKSAVGQVNQMGASEQLGEMGIFGKITEIRGIQSNQMSLGQADNLKMDTEKMKKTKKLKLEESQKIDESEEQKSIDYNSRLLRYQKQNLDRSDEENIKDIDMLVNKEIPEASSQKDQLIKELKYQLIAQQQQFRKFKKTIQRNVRSRKQFITESENQIKNVDILQDEEIISLVRSGNVENLLKILNRDKQDEEEREKQYSKSKALLRSIKVDKKNTPQNNIRKDESIIEFSLKEEDIKENIRSFIQDSKKPVNSTNSINFIKECLGFEDICLTYFVSRMESDPGKLSNDTVKKNNKELLKDQYRDACKMVIENTKEKNEKQMRTSIQRAIVPLFKELCKQIINANRQGPERLQELKLNYSTMPLFITNRFNMNFGVKKVASKHIVDLIVSLRGIKKYTDQYSLISHFLINPNLIRNSGMIDKKNTDLFFFYVLLVSMRDSIFSKKEITEEEGQLVVYFAEKYLTKDDKLISVIQNGLDAGDTSFLNFTRMIILEYEDLYEQRTQEMQFIFRALCTKNTEYQQTFSLGLFVDFISPLYKEEKEKEKLEWIQRDRWQSSVIHSMIDILREERVASGFITKELFDKFVIKCPQFSFQALKKRIYECISINEQERNLQNQANQQRLIEICKYNEMLEQIVAYLLSNKETIKIEEKQFWLKYIKSRITETNVESILGNVLTGVLDTKSGVFLLDKQKKHK